jgi:hypothetical protein
MITWAGWLIVFFGAAHTLGALTAEGAATHAGAWFSQELWEDDLADMSPAMSAYWLSVNSFGPSDPGRPDCAVARPPRRHSALVHRMVVGRRPWSMRCSPGRESGRA